MPNKSNSAVAFAKRSCCVSERVRACVRGSLRACVREQNTENFELSAPPPPHLLPSSFFFLLLAIRPPGSFRQFFLSLSLSLSFSCSSFDLRAPSPEAKEASVPLRLTFSGMNYFARQVAGRLRKNSSSRFVESVSCCLRSPK